MYTRWLDEDFVEAEGDYNAALKRKRVRAEHNLIRFKIINNLIEGKELSESERSYIKKWK